MSKNLQERLSHMIYEFRGIKAEMTLLNLNQEINSGNKLKIWKTLADKVSEKWTEVSSVEEISQQREKSW